MGGVAAPGFGFVRTPIRLRAALEHAPKLVGAVVTVVGATILLGWFAGIDEITTPHRSFRQMVAYSAVMSILAGLSLALDPRSNKRRLAAWLCAVVLCAMSAIALAEYVIGSELFTHRRLHEVGTRPAWQSCVAFLLIGAAQLGRTPRIRRGDRLAIIFALAAMAIAGLALLGFVFGAHVLYGETEVEPDTGMSPMTALLVFAIGLGILATKTKRSVFSIVVADDAGGVVARRLLAGLTLFLPLALCVVVGARLGWYALALASAVVLFLTLTLGTASILVTARRLGGVARTERAAVEELRSERERVRMIVEAAADAIFIADSNGRYLEVNAAACQLLRCAPEDIVGKHLSDLVLPEALPRLARATEKLLDGKVISGEWELLRKDGSLVPVELVGQRLPDGRLQGIARDVTERRRVQRALAEVVTAESRRRYWLQAILDQLPEGIVVRDAEGAIDSVNRSMARWQVDDGPFDETGHRRLFDVRDQHRRSVDFVDLPVMRALRSGQATADEELVLRLQDGSMLPVSARAAPIRDRDGQVIGAVGIVRDISEHKELQRLRDEWIAIIAHDLRQPIGAIRLAAGLLLETDRSPEARRFLEQIASTSNRLDRMISDLLDASRVAADQLSLQRRSVDLGVLIHAMIEQSRLDDPKSEIRLVTPQHQRAWIDPQRIEQVIGNLLSNAVKYRVPGTPIVVEVVRIHDDVRVCVCNEGPAIAPDERQKLFGRFRRTRRAKSSAKPGIGLGLYICKGIVEAHGGDIWVEADAGTIRFYFTVPVNKPD